MSLEQKVKDIIVDQLGVDAAQVTPEASFIDDLSADSPDEDAEKLTTVGSVIKYLQEKGITAD